MVALSRLDAQIPPARIPLVATQARTSLSGCHSGWSLVCRGAKLALGQANRYPRSFAPFPSLFRPYSHEQVVNISDLVIVIRPEVQMPLHNRGGTIGADMNVGKIECQKLVRATSYTLQICGFVLDRTVGVCVREIICSDCHVENKGVVMIS